MKLKYNVLTAMLIVFLLLAGIISTQAQGFFGNANSTVNRTEPQGNGKGGTGTTGDSTNGQFFRSDSGDFGDGGEDREPAPRAATTRTPQSATGCSS